MPSLPPQKVPPPQKSRQKRGRSRSPTASTHLAKTSRAPKPPPSTGIDALDLLRAMEEESKRKR